MAERKEFDIRTLYPSGYSFDWEAFEQEPENYVFSRDDIAYTNAMELERYELETPMTPYEKRAVRRWVASGHSVREAPPSKYGCVYPVHPAPDFLDVYRTDKKLDNATKGMSKEQRDAYLKEYAGYEEWTEQERRDWEEKELIHSQTPEEARKKIGMLQRQLHYIWIYLAQEGLWEEAEEFLKDHMDEPVPFEDEW